MITRTSTFALGAVLLIQAAQVSAGAPDSTSMETAASARTFATEAGTDWYRQQQRIAAELRAEDWLARLHQAPTEASLEPCINGNVSPDGTFPSAELQAIAEALSDPLTAELLENSAYYATVAGGREIVN